MKASLPHAIAMPLQIPFVSLMILGLAASALLLTRSTPAPRPAYVVAGDAAASPYGSGAAVRNLLF